jgi:hypothetical protein
VFTLRRAQLPSRTAHDRRPVLVSINLQPLSFSKRQLSTIALVLDEEEKNAALSDIKKRLCVHKCFRSRKSEGEHWTVYKELADDKMKFINLQL